MDLLIEWYKRPDLARFGQAFASKKLNYDDKCWVCARKFSNHVLREDHHIIPSAFGGHDGPQVSLCSDHHSLLHKIADLLVPLKGVEIDAIKPFFMGLTNNELSRTMYLSTRAAMAERLFKDDPNRGVQVTVTFPNTLLAEIKKAATILNMPVADLMTEAVTDYLRKRFPLSHSQSMQR